MGNRDRFDGVAEEDLRQFRDISVNVRIQFRAEDNHDPVPQELCVKPCVGERDTVSGDKQIGIVKIRRCRIQEFELDRPLTESDSVVPPTGCRGPEWGIVLAAEPGQPANGPGPPDPP